MDCEKTKKTKHNKYLLFAEAEIDLHGFTKIEARDSLDVFIENARNNKLKLVRIITGKGLHSENGQSILSGYVKSLLEKEGLKYSDAKLYNGGSGAIDVQFF